jgi:hypothetical protein
MDENSHISYQINKQDEIIFVNDEWFQFASANDASSLTRENVLCRSLWDFISDDKVKYLYQEILRRVNAGHSLKFNLRCDSPEMRRIIEMKITPQKDDEVKFDSRTIWTQSRMPAIIFKNATPPTDNLLIMCSWCNKIETGNGKWEEVEEAIESLGLFELETLPTISHGMCDSCCQTASLMLKDLTTA